MRNSMLRMFFVCLVGLGFFNTASGEEIFYPQPPNEPKMQHLVGFSSVRDLQPPENWFVRFVLGRDASKKDDLVKPYGAKMVGNKIFVCDPMAGVVQSIDLTKNTEETIGAKGQGKLSQPVNLDADNEKIYVADRKHGQVMVYENQSPFKFLAAYGREGQFAPAAVQVMDEKLIVSDVLHHEIVVLNKNTGEFLYKFGGPGIQDGKFKYPLGLAMDSQKRLYVVDGLNFRFQVFNLDDKQATHLLSFGKIGQAVTDLSRPKGIAVDPKGRVWITDILISDSAQVLSSTIKIFGTLEELKDGDFKNDFVMAFGGEGGGTQAGDVFMPVSVDISADKESIEATKKYAAKDFEPEFVVVVVNQLQGNSNILKKLNIYGWGNKRVR